MLLVLEALRVDDQMQPLRKAKGFKYFTCKLNFEKPCSFIMIVSLAAAFCCPTSYASTITSNDMDNLVWALHFTMILL